MGACRFFYHGIDTPKFLRESIGQAPESISNPSHNLGNGVSAESLTVEKKRANDMIDRLDEMESKDMQDWQEILMPPGSQCIIITGLGVRQEYGQRGVGSSLVKWGADQADEHGVFMWVHSSEAAYRTYARNGFGVVGILDVDLDEYAPGPPPEGNGAKWGHYTIRYMKRLPKAN